jgi:hypothetical protein
MVKTTNMEWHNGFSFIVGEDNIPVCVVTVDLLGNIRCMMFSDKYNENAIEPVEWMMGMVIKMKELRLRKAIAIDKLIFVATKDNVVALLKNIGFKKDGEQWIYSLV